MMMMTTMINKVHDGKKTETREKGDRREQMKNMKTKMKNRTRAASATITRTRTR